MKNPAEKRGFLFFTIGTFLISKLCRWQLTRLSFHFQSEFNLISITAHFHLACLSRGWLFSEFLSPNLVESKRGQVCFNRINHLV